MRNRETHRDTVRSESLGLVARNRREEGIALSVARQSDLGGGNEEGKLGRAGNRYGVQFKVVFEAIRELHGPPTTKKRKIGFLVKERAARYGRTP